MPIVVAFVCCPHRIARRVAVDASVWWRQVPDVAMREALLPVLPSWLSTLSPDRITAIPSCDAAPLDDSRTTTTTVGSLHRLNKAILRVLADSDASSLSLILLHDDLVQSFSGRKAVLAAMAAHLNSGASSAARRLVTCGCYRLVTSGLHSENYFADLAAHLQVSPPLDSPLRGGGHVNSIDEPSLFEGFHVALVEPAPFSQLDQFPFQLGRSFLPPGQVSCTRLRVTIVVTDAAVDVLRDRQVRSELGPHRRRTSPFPRSVMECARHIARLQGQPQGDPSLPSSVDIVVVLLSATGDTFLLDDTVGSSTSASPAPHDAFVGTSLPCFCLNADAISGGLLSPSGNDPVRAAARVLLAAMGRLRMHWHAEVTEVQVLQAVKRASHIGFTKEIADALRATVVAVEVPNGGGDAPAAANWEGANVEGDLTGMHDSDLPSRVTGPPSRDEARQTLRQWLRQLLVRLAPDGDGAHGSMLTTPLVADLELGNRQHSLALKPMTRLSSLVCHASRAVAPLPNDGAAHPTIPNGEPAPDHQAFTSIAPSTTTKSVAVGVGCVDAVSHLPGHWVSIAPAVMPLTQRKGVAGFARNSEPARTPVASLPPPPRAPLTNWITFCNERRSQVMADLAAGDAADKLGPKKRQNIMMQANKQMAELWKAMPKDEKDRRSERYAAEMDVYRAALAAYVAEYGALPSRVKRHRLPDGVGHPSAAGEAGGTVAAQIDASDAFDVVPAEWTADAETGKWRCAWDSVVPDGGASGEDDVDEVSPVTRGMPRLGTARALSGGSGTPLRVPSSSVPWRRTDSGRGDTEEALGGHSTCAVLPASTKSRRKVQFDASKK